MTLDNQLAGRLSHTVLHQQNDSILPARLNSATIERSVSVSLYVCWVTQQHTPAGPAPHCGTTLLIFQLYASWTPASHCCYRMRCSHRLFSVYSTSCLFSSASEESAAEEICLRVWAVRPLSVRPIKHILRDITYGFEWILSSWELALLKSFQGQLLKVKVMTRSIIEDSSIMMEAYVLTVGCRGRFA